MLKELKEKQEKLSKELEAIRLEILDQSFLDAFNKDSSTMLVEFQYDGCLRTYRLDPKKFILTKRETPC